MAGAAVAAAARRSGILRRPPSALFTKTSKPWPSSCASLPLVSSASDSLTFSFSSTAPEVGPPAEPASSCQRWQGFRDVPNAQRFGTGGPAVDVDSSASPDLESFSVELKKGQAQFGLGFPCGGQATVARSLQKQEDILRNLTAYDSGGQAGYADAVPQIVRQPKFGGWRGGVPAWQDCLIRRLFSRQLKTLKVVLSEEVEGLGRAGQVVSVAPGYARNKLIPHHLALPALPKYVSLVNNQLKMARPHLLIDKEEVASRTSSEEEQLEEIETALKRLDVSKVVFRRHVSSLNNLRHAVTKEDIVFEVKRQTGVQLAVSNVILPADLNLLGEFEVQLRFPNDVRFPKGKDKLYLNVRIRRK